MSYAQHLCLKVCSHIEEYKSLNKSLNQVSTGRRINGAADDVAANGVAVRWRQYYVDLSGAANINDISYVQTIEEAWKQPAVLLRLRIVGPGSKRYTSSDRSMILAEMTQILSTNDCVRNIVGNLFEYTGKCYISGR